MKNMIHNIAYMSVSDYAEFCSWLRECCGTSISELIEKPPTHQLETWQRWYDVTYGSHFDDLAES